MFNNFCRVRDGTNASYFRLKKDDFLLVCLSIIKHCIRVIFEREHLGYHNTSPEKDIKIYNCRVRDRCRVRDKKKILSIIYACFILYLY